MDRIARCRASLRKRAEADGTGFSSKLLDVRIEPQKVPGRIGEEIVVRIAARRKRNVHAARFVLAVALHMLVRESVLLKKPDQLIAQPVGSNPRANEGVESQLPGMEGEVGWRTAGAAGLRKAIPEQLAESDDDRLIRHSSLRCGQVCYNRSVRLSQEVMQ